MAKTQQRVIGDFCVVNRPPLTGAEIRLSAPKSRNSTNRELSSMQRYLNAFSDEVAQRPHWFHYKKLHRSRFERLWLGNASAFIVV